MKTMLAVHGIGALGACGRGPEAFYGGTPPSGSSVCRVAPDTLQDRNALRKLRRADRFCKMSALAAWDAFNAAGRRADGFEGSHPGIILATAFGPHNTTFAFLDEIIDFGDADVSPTKFSHSVHNAAVSYIALMLGSRGPACTIADFQRPLYAALLTAAVWLRENRCRRVLVGYTEEISDPLEYIARQGNYGRDKKNLQPFRLSPHADAVLSEGSVFLALTLAGKGGYPFDYSRFAGKNGITDICSLLHFLAPAKRD